ncbi:tectonic [Anopheles arabiensis]|uniref:tectonic n=1 Tax=Anopheles arabiensis TaxID=7173 RepID=UPI001AAD230D|nr:tectonic [Anopheles arabiensis]
MALSCVEGKRVVALCWSLVLLVVACGVVEGGERNVQLFVKIDVAKINVKNATDASGNVSSSTTPMGEATTEMSTTISTTEGTTSSSTAAQTTSKTTASEQTVTVESTAAGTATTATPTVDPTDVAHPSFPAGRAAKLVPKGYYCRCDLTINVCDINCCCDIDCSAAILRTFDCDQELLHTDEYHHGEGLQSCRVQGGLFCLVEPVYEEGDESFYNAARLPAATRYKWKEVFPLDGSSEEAVRPNHYHVDDVIYFYNETSELVQPFAIPYSLTGSSCQLEQPVRFLRDRTNLCRRQTVDELSDFNRAFLRHASSSARFFQTPKKSTVMEHYCVEDGDCLNATVSICYHNSPHGWNCTQSSNVTNSTSSVEELLLEEFPDSTCLELEITFIHNYTNLFNVQLKLLCERSADEDDLWMESVWQRITVRFIVPTPPSKPKLTRTVSGNIGYLTGKPLIVSHREFPANRTTPQEGSPPEESSPSNRMLAYFTNETRLPDTSFRLRLPISRANRCTLTENCHGTINFGTDSFHRCNYIPPELVNQTAGQNFTKFCQTLQVGLYDQLLNGVYPELYPTKGEGYDKLNLYLSKYGNPRNRSTDWVRVRSTNVVADAEPGSEQASAGSTTDNTTDSYFTCTNMLISVNYRFYYARTRVRDVRHQAVAHDAEIVFGPRVNLRFRLEEEIRVPIFLQVQFFDLTSSSSSASFGVVGFGKGLLVFGVVFTFFVLR